MSRENGSYSIFSGNAAGQATPREGTRIRRWSVVPDAMGAGVTVTITRQGGQVDSVTVPPSAFRVDVEPGGNQTCSVFDVAGDVLVWILEVVR